MSRSTPPPSATLASLADAEGARSVVSRRAFVVGATGSLAASLVGCGAGGAGGLVASYPRWEGRGRELFPDLIEPSAVGLTFDVPVHRADPLFRARAQSAELVTRARVQTINVEIQASNEPRYSLVLELEHPTLATPKWDVPRLELRIDGASPSYGVVRALETRLKGRIFVAFFHRFASNEPGVPVPRWFFATDTPESVAAVREAVALGELSR